jgi:uncharacterized coiled-coil protein SlyX
MPTLAEQLIEHLEQHIAALEMRAKRTKAMLPHLAGKYHERWKATIASTWQRRRNLTSS